MGTREFSSASSYAAQKAITLHNRARRCGKDGEEVNVSVGTQVEFPWGNRDLHSFLDPGAFCGDPARIADPRLNRMHRTVISQRVSIMTRGCDLCSACSSICPAYIEIEIVIEKQHRCDNTENRVTMGDARVG
ncbi:hypothetical protein HN011_004029 [Eciton burchellii]|nr:hypothetical protein HN011_004029 [Eciton burchellii]